MKRTINEIHKLIEEKIENAKRERDRYKNKWGRVKNVIQKEGWQLDLIEKAYKHLIHMDRIFDDVEDSRNNFMEIRKEFEAVLEERK